MKNPRPILHRNTGPHLPTRNTGALQAVTLNPARQRRSAQHERCTLLPLSAKPMITIIPARHREAGAALSAPLHPRAGVLQLLQATRGVHIRHLQTQAGIPTLRHRTPAAPTLHLHGRPAATLHHHALPVLRAPAQGQAAAAAAPAAEGDSSILLTQLFINISKACYLP